MYCMSFDSCTSCIGLGQVTVGGVVGCREWMRWGREGGCVLCVFGSDCCWLCVIHAFLLCCGWRMHVQPWHTHTRKKTHTHHISQTHVYTDREHIELPAKLLDDFTKVTSVKGWKICLQALWNAFDNMLASIFWNAFVISESFLLTCTRCWPRIASVSRMRWEREMWSTRVWKLATLLKQQTVCTLPHR